MKISLPLGIQSIIMFSQDLALLFTARHNNQNCYCRLSSVGYRRTASP